MDATVGALAAQLDGEVLGDAELKILAVDSLEKSDSIPVTSISATRRTAGNVWLC